MAVGAHRRGSGLLVQVAGDDHVGVGHDHHHVAGGVTRAEVDDLDVPVAQVDHAGQCQRTVRRPQLFRVEPQIGRLGGDLIGLQGRFEAFVAVGGQVVEGGESVEVVEVCVSDHGADQRHRQDFFRGRPDRPTLGGG